MARRAISSSCTVVLAAPPARPSSWEPSGWSRSQFSRLAMLMFRSGSQGIRLLRRTSRAATAGASWPSWRTCSSTSGKSTWASPRLRPARNTRTSSRARGRFRRSRVITRVVGTSRATARMMAPKSTSRTQRSSQASKPNTTRASAPSNARLLKVSRGGLTSRFGCVSRNPACRG